MNHFAKKTASINIDDNDPESLAVEEGKVKRWGNILLKLGAIINIPILILKSLGRIIRAIVSLRWLKRLILSAIVSPIRNALAREVVTVNIESTDLRIMITKAGRVKWWGSVPLEPGVVKEGLILNHQAVSTAMGEIIASKRLKKGKATTSLSGIQSVNRMIDLPKMPRKLLKNAILVEAKRVIPISMDQVYLSWHRISGQKDAVQRFFLLGVPRNMLDVEVQCLRRAGIDPRTIYLKPMALAKMANRAEALLIDIESEICTIIVLTGGVPIIMRSVAMRPGHSSLDRAPYVLQELERTLQFYESSYPGHPLSHEMPLFLTGKLADEEEFYQAIASGVAYNIEPLESPMQCPSDFPLAQFAVNMGLTLKGAPSAAKRTARDGRFLTIDFNILPDEYHPRRLSAKQLLLALGTLAGIALILPLYQITDDVTTKASKRQDANNILERRVNLRQSQYEEVNRIKGAIADVESRRQDLLDILNDFQDLQDHRSRFYNSLYVSTVGILPDNVTLSSIVQEDGKLKLVGLAPSYESALAYAKALRNTDGFFDVQVLSLERVDGEEETVSFVIDSKWE